MNNFPFCCHILVPPGVLCNLAIKLIIPECLSIFKFSTAVGPELRPKQLYIVALFNPLLTISLPG